MFTLWPDSPNIAGVRIEFASARLKKKCMKAAKLGDQKSIGLRSRLMEMHLADTVSDLVDGDPHPLVGDGKGLFSLVVHQGWRLVFKGAGEHSGSTRWASIDHVTITYIGDYHAKKRIQRIRP